MTLPPNMPPMPDPRRLLAKMQADVRAFETRAERTNAALAAAAVESSGDVVTVRMLGAHLVGIVFHDAALALSPAQLAEEVRRTTATAKAQANHASADVVRHAFGDETAARGVEDALDDELAAERPAARTEAEARAEAERPMTPEEQEDLLDDLLHRMDVDDEPMSVAEVAKELDYARNRSVGAPEDQQALFEAEMDRIKASAAVVPRLMESIEGVAQSETVEITVNAAGVLRSTRFRAAFTRLSTEELAADFLETYAGARSDASRRLASALADDGFHVDESTRRALGL